MDVLGIEITKREVVASIAIVGIMASIGFFISGKIDNYSDSKRTEYSKAVRIERAEAFEYGMRTHIGNALVFGELTAVDPVGYPGVEGEYIEISQTTEQYTMHTRMVPHTVNGETTYTTEMYWTWDEIASETKQCEQVEMLGIIFAKEKISPLYMQYVGTVRASSELRYNYSGAASGMVGTMFTNLSGGEVGENSIFYESDIDSVLEKVSSRWGVKVFWTVWVILMVVCVSLFFCEDNYWLE